MSRWETVAVVDVGPHESGGIKYGGIIVYQRFNNGRTTPKKAKGWRRHLRKMKTEKRQGDRVPPLPQDNLS